MKHTVAAVIAFTLLPSTALADKGDIVQSDNLGMSMVSWNLSKGKTTSVADQQALSEFVGAHYYVTDKVRVGMNLQFTEVLNPEPTYSRFSKFALLPQVGWNFWGPMFVAGVFTFAPRTQGVSQVDLGLQAVVGAGFRLTDAVKLTVAVEVPWDFSPDEVVGITPLVGVSIKL